MESAYYDDGDAHDYFAIIAYANRINFEPFSAFVLDQLRMHSTKYCAAISNNPGRLSWSVILFTSII